MKDVAYAVSAAKNINNIAYEFTKKYPARFKAFALLPMQDPLAAVEELERCVRELGFVGVFLHGHTNFSYYDENKYEVFWEKLQELDVPLYLHVTNPEADQIRIYDGYDELLGNTWNWGYVAATHALRIIFGGVFDKFPDAKLMLGHMGEGLPYLMGRLDEGYEARMVWKKGRMKNPPSYYIKKNLYITTSGGYRPEALRCAIDALGADRVMFATDYPHVPTQKAVEQIEACALTEQEKELIYHKNAEKLLRIKN